MALGQRDGKSRLEAGESAFEGVNQLRQRLGHHDLRVHRFRASTRTDLEFLRQHRPGKQRLRWCHQHGASYGSHILSLRWMSYRVGKRLSIITEMTRRRMPRRQLPEYRHLAHAALHGMWAARVEMASGGRVERRGNL